MLNNDAQRGAKSVLLCGCILLLRLCRRMSDARLTSEEEREEKRTEKNPIEPVKKGAITVVSRSSQGDIQFTRS